jgi:hypothetical protein
MFLSLANMSSRKGNRPQNSMSEEESLMTDEEEESSTDYPVNATVKSIIPTLSIDIGIRHLGYSILNGDGLIFDIFDIEGTIKKDPKLKKLNSVPVQRAYVLNQFLTEIVDKYSIERIIVERQVQTNTVAMELMYSIISLCITKIPLEALIIYDPKKKFTDLHLKYSTKNKAHKRLSISVCREKLSQLYPVLVNDFDSHSKKDDIADSILMNLLVNRII